MNVLIIRRSQEVSFGICCMNIVKCSRCLIKYLLGTSPSIFSEFSSAASIYMCDFKSEFLKLTYCQY